MTRRNPKLARYGDCHSKQRYRDRDQAKRVRQLRQKDGAGFLRIYECPHCRGWHLTSKPEYGA